MTDMQLMEKLLPSAPEYYRLVILAWLVSRKQRINDSNVKAIYFYLIGDISYEKMLDHFDLPFSQEETIL